jgi:broad specificity phosphatase PhoE
MSVWAADALPSAPERWSDFRGRVLAALEDQAAAGGSAAIVTSGGVIGLAVAAALELGPDGMARLGVAIENTSLHRLAWRGGRWRLLEFGATPHLASADRGHARTYV